MDIYDRIDNLLHRKKLSRRKLAIMANIPPTTLQSAFGRQSKGLSFEYLQRIADILDVSVDYLFGIDHLFIHVDKEDEDDSFSDFVTVIEVLEDYGFDVSFDEDDEAVGIVRLNHAEENIEVVEDKSNLIRVIQKIIADSEEEKDSYIKRRLFDIYGGRIT